MTNLMSPSKKMSTIMLKEKIGQMFVIGFEPDQNMDIPTYVKELITDYYVGSIILFSRNITGRSQVKQLTSQLQQLAKDAHHSYPLFICVDQENGVVDRLGKTITSFPGANALGQRNDPSLSKEIGHATAKELKSLGINWNLAPVADINSNPNNPVIGVRSFSNDSQSVADHAIGFMQGTSAASVLPTLKHFPGHGDTSVDSHYNVPIISKSKDDLKRVELIPFIKGIEASCEAILVSHLHVPSLQKDENVPASCSYNIITKLLRNELCYNGLVTTDCLEMGAIKDVPNAAKESILAGADLIMISHTKENQLQTLTFINESVHTGLIKESIIDASFRRIEAMKRKYALSEDISESLDSCVQTEHKLLADESFRKTLSLLTINKNILPLSHNSQNLLIISPTLLTASLAEDTNSPSDLFGQTFSKKFPYAEVMSYESLDEILRTSFLSNKIIIAGVLLQQNPTLQIKIIEQLKQRGQKIIAILLRNQSDMDHLPCLDAYIATYEPTKKAIQTAADGLSGAFKIRPSTATTCSLNWEKRF